MGRVELWVAGALAVLWFLTRALRETKGRMDLQVNGPRHGERQEAADLDEIRELERKCGAAVSDLQAMLAVFATSTIDLDPDSDLEKPVRLLLRQIGQFLVVHTKLVGIDLRTGQPAARVRSTAKAVIGGMVDATLTISAARQYLSLEVDCDVVQRLQGLWSLVNKQFGGLLPRGRCPHPNAGVVNFVEWYSQS